MERSEIRDSVSTAIVVLDCAALHPGYETTIFAEPKIPIDAIPILLYIFRVLFEEGALSRSDPLSGQSESWPDRGAPERSTARWLVERWEALRLALGAHGHLAVRGGSIDPPPRGA